MAEPTREDEKRPDVLDTRERRSEVFNRWLVGLSLRKEAKIGRSSASDCANTGQFVSYQMTYGVINGA